MGISQILRPAPLATPSATAAPAPTAAGRPTGFASESERNAWKNSRSKVKGGDPGVRRRTKGGLNTIFSQMFGASAEKLG